MSPRMKRNTRMVMSHTSRVVFSLMPRILSAAMGSVATIFVVDAVPKRDPD
jgi:hypothetical protein